MSLPSTSIKRPVTVIRRGGFYIGVALLGIFEFSRIGVDLLPDYIDICLRISKEA